MSVEDIFFKLNRLHRMALVGAVCALILGLFWFFLVSGMLDSIKRTEKKISRMKLEIVNQQNTLKKKPILEKQLKKLREKLKGMVASLPQKQEIELLIKKINDLVSRAALVQKQFVPGRERINKKLQYARIPFSLVVQGDYQKQGNFFASLHDLPRIINVPTVNMKRTGMGGREGALARKLGLVTLQANIRAVTYRRLSKQEIKRLEQKKKKKRGRGRRRRR